MAVDTRQKRFSMMSLGEGNHLIATFEADGTVDVDDRQHLLDCYSGIAFASPGGVTAQLILLTRGTYGAASVLGGGMA